VKTIKTQLDTLIDWYEKFKPEAGKRIPCACTRDTLLKFASPPSPGGKVLYYRGREVYPTKVKEKA
jgi:hypothetical protein